MYASLTSASLSVLYSMYFSPRTEPQYEPPKECNARVTAATFCSPQMEKIQYVFPFSNTSFLLPYAYFYDSAEVSPGISYILYNILDLIDLGVFLQIPKKS